MSEDLLTATFQISNTDGKLTQLEWADFYAQCDAAAQQTVARVRFAAPSPADAPWQNACWVVQCTGDQATVLKGRLREIRQRFRQDAVAWTAGRAEFV